VTDYSGMDWSTGRQALLSSLSLSEAAPPRRKPEPLRNRNPKPPPPPPGSSPSRSWRFLIIGGGGGEERSKSLSFERTLMSLSAVSGGSWRNMRRVLRRRRRRTTGLAVGLWVAVVVAQRVARSLKLWRVEGIWMRLVYRERKREIRVRVVSFWFHGGETKER